MGAILPSDVTGFREELVLGGMAPVRKGVLRGTPSEAAAPHPAQSSDTDGGDMV